MTPASSPAISANPGAARRPRRWLAWLLLLLLVAGLFAMIAIPVFQIMPFKSQTPGALQVAFYLVRWSSLATLLGGILALALTVYLWPRSRWYKRALLVLLLGVSGLLFWFARQNHFEWMFHSLPNPAYAEVNDASYVSDTDQVIAVQLGNEAVAYPVRQMAYHHVVGDTVGGTPIVATY